jgi:hypothetical protein
MNRTVAALVGLIASLHSFAGQENEVVVQTARSLRPDVHWNQLSVFKADIDCDGKMDFVILGNNKLSAILFVFNRGFSEKPIEYIYSLEPYGEREFQIYAEELNFSEQNLLDMLGPDHKNYQRSKTCKGIYLYDGERDGVHLYWVKRQNSFAFWSN